MDNPYAPPPPVADATDLSNVKPENYAEVSLASACVRGLGGSLCAGGCVLLYQVIRHWFGVPRGNQLGPAIIPEAASFGSAILFTTLAFQWGNTDARKVGFTLLTSMVGFLFVLVWLYLLYSQQASGWLIFILLPASQLSAVAINCWIHCVRIRPLRLVIGGVLAMGGWVGLTLLAVRIIVQPLSYPQDDYAGYTLLTMFWCWSVALQMPLMLNKRLRLHGEP